MEHERLSALTTQQRDRIGVADAGRWLIARNQTRGGPAPAARFFVDTWPSTLATSGLRRALDTDLYTKAAVPPGTTTDPAWGGALAPPAWLEPLVSAMQRDSILSRVPGFVQAPLRTPIPYAPVSPAMAWIAQGAAKPVSQLTFGTITLALAKCGEIEILTDELLRVSAGADRVVSAKLITASTVFIDKNFLDPAVAAVADKNPASITNGVTPVTPGANIDASIAALVAQLYTQRPNTLAPTFLLSSVVASKIAGTGNHDDVTTTGSGRINGTPAYVTQGVGGGSALVLVDASGIYYHDGGAEIDLSQFAAVQMDSAPTSPATAATILRDLWSHNETGIRLDRWVTWQAEPTAVAYVVIP